MKIGIFSDTHLGYSSGELFDEAFERFDEAIAFFKEKKVDLILHAGDMFNDSIPSQEVLAKTFLCLSKNNGEEKTFFKKNNEGQKEVLVRGIPFIAIHGTHEHRGKDFSNALEVLENAGFLIHLHGNRVEFEDVVIHGMGGVPERVAKKVLENYSPTPVQNKTNVFLMHQSFKEYLPFDDTMVATLSLSDLPNDFDLIINGHLHWRSEENLSGKRFLLTGSTIFTQMKNLESKKDKGVFIFDSDSKELNFFPFEKQRKLFYEKIRFEKTNPVEVKEKINEKISFLLKESFSKKPLVRLKLVGTLAKGFSSRDVDLELPIDKAIFSVSKEFSSIDFSKSMKSFKDAHMEKKSVSEIGVDILEKKVEEAGLKNFDSRRVFSLLSENEVEKTNSLLQEKANKLR